MKLILLLFLVPSCLGDVFKHPGYGKNIPPVPFTLPPPTTCPPQIECPKCPPQVYLPPPSCPPPVTPPPVTCPPPPTLKCPSPRPPCTTSAPVTCPIVTCPPPPIVKCPPIPRCPEPVECPVPSLYVVPPPTDDEKDVNSWDHHCVLMRNGEEKLTTDTSTVGLSLSSTLNQTRYQQSEFETPNSLKQNSNTAK